MTLRSMMAGRWEAGLACAAAALLAISPAEGQQQLLASAGAWHAFGGMEPSLKKPGCAVQYGERGRHFGLKYFQNDKEITVHLGDSQWKVAEGGHEKFWLSMDNFGEWEIVGVGVHFPDGDGGLEFNLQGNEIEQFIHQFTASNAMRVRFVSPGIQPWQLSLSGTLAVTEAMSICLRALP